MDTKLNVCHDLKTERTDVAPPLPAVASALPIAFYLGCVAAVGLNVMFWLNTKKAKEQEEGFAQDTATEVRLRGESVAKVEALKKEEKRANDVLTWVEGARSFQPVIINIAKIIEPKASIVELALTRGVSDSKQISMTVKLEGLTNDRSQIESIEESLLSMGYRTYGGKRTRGKGKGSLTYEATLMWNENYSENLTANTNQNDE